MKVLIFGGTGLIGSYVAADLCERGFDVTVFDQAPPGRMLRAQESGLGVIQGDVADAEQVMRAVTDSQAQRIVHLAAVLQFGCEEDPPKALRVNVGGTLNVLEAARQNGVERVVFASSGAAYGIQSGTLREDGAVGPWLSIYGTSKLLGERLGEQYARQHGFTFIALRYGITFGPGKGTSPGMAKVLQDVVGTTDGTPVTIDEVGGELCRQVTYVRDSAAGTVVALTHENPSFGLYNVAGPDDNFVSLQRFHQICTEVVPGTAAVTFTGQGRAAGPMDTSRIRDDLGFVPAYSVAEGIRARIEEDGG